MKLLLLLVVMVVKFYQVVTSSISYSGLPTLTTSRPHLSNNYREMATYPSYWKFIKTPGIGHGMKDYDYAEEIPSKFQMNSESLLRFHHPVLSNNRTFLKPTAKFQGESFQNKKLFPLRLETQSKFKNKRNFTSVEHNKNSAKINSNKNFFALVWFPEFVSTEVDTKTVNNSSFGTVPDEVSVKANPDTTLADGRMTSESISVNDQNRSPRVYSMGRGLSSYLSVGNGHIMTKFIFDIPNKCPPRHQLDGQGGCRQIFSSHESIYNKDSMYLSPLKTSSVRKQNNTFSNISDANNEIYLTTSTTSSYALELSDKPLEVIRPTDIFVIGLNDSTDQPEELISVYQESVTQRNVYKPLVNRRANQGNMLTNSANNISNESQLLNSAENSVLTVENLSHFTNLELTTSDDFYFDSNDFKSNNSDSSLRTQESNSSSVLNF